MPSKIFICYRRDDSADAAGRLSDSLFAHFDEDQIFMDIEYIEPGEDFVRVLTEAVSSCQILIAVIGKSWLSSSKDGSTRRLDDPNDFVRLEIATALSRNVPVIPVLVQGATMPAPRDLPDELIKLSYRQAFELSYMRWKRDVEILITNLKRILERQEEVARRAEEQRQREAAEAAEAQRKRDAEAASRLAEEKGQPLQFPAARSRAGEIFRAIISKGYVLIVIILTLISIAFVGVQMMRKSPTKQDPKLEQGSDPQTQANKLVSEANDELKEVDKIADDSDPKSDELSKADDAGDAEKVKSLLEDLIKIMDIGFEHGLTASGKLYEAARLNIDDKYKEYLSLKSQSLRMQLEAFKERKDAAKIMHDNYDNPDTAAMQKAKEEFKKKNYNYRNLLSEAKDMSRKADDIARANPNIGKAP